MSVLLLLFSVGKTCFMEGTPFGALCFFDNLYPIKLYTQKTKGMVATESRWEINAMPAAAEVSCP